MYIKKTSMNTILLSTIVATSANATNVPLNQYGAVDVNANVPVSIQVPPAPPSFNTPNVTSAAEVWSDKVPSQPHLNVKSYILLDSDTGNIIAEQNANLRIAPASLTKLMLLYIVEEQLKNKTITLDTKLIVPTVAWGTGGSRMFLKPHTSVPVKDLIEGVIVASGNDAAVTLATGIAGTQSAFVDMMNLTAKKLGMTNTNFSDVMGLPAPNLYTSARDLGILAQHVINDYPEYYSFYKNKYFKYNGVKQPNFNKLLFIDPYADGLKTGSTAAAGFSLISSEKRENKRRLISVVIGANNGTDSAYDSLSLLKYGEQFFSTRELYNPYQKITNSQVYMGAKNNIDLGSINKVSITYPSAIDTKNIIFTISKDTPFKAPIYKLQKMGELDVNYNGKVISRTPLVALNNVKSGSMLKRLKDKVTLWFY
jgi:serine-type D-Ala-D-Ala carboxypeptidase (penicillin-binding protein 5/6)